MIYVFHLHLKPNDGHRKILDFECDTQQENETEIIFYLKIHQKQKPVKQPCTNYIVNLCYIVIACYLYYIIKMFLIIIFRSNLIVCSFYVNFYFLIHTNTII
eukprot:TRINITY_DN74477_c0_g1_i1.p1 TRINITY_DN74477_c0_g1~~TRINITY_DN74477_c0_g1_i1.p1  ORF type:complete len:102 (+),score=0.28 TRINITY_DN74477_c0_g1_i1:146-451(+)